MFFEIADQDVWFGDSAGAIERLRAWRIATEATPLSPETLSKGQNERQTHNIFTSESRETAVVTRISIPRKTTGGLRLRRPTVKTAAASGNTMHYAKAAIQRLQSLPKA